MTVQIHKNDLPDGLDFGKSVAIDTETLGLNPLRDRLCLVQLSAGDGTVHIVQMDGEDYSAPNLKKLLEDKSVEKIFHFARFDVAVMKHYLGADCSPVFCTKIASKLTRTYTDRHGLKDVVREFCNTELDKQQQSSDWAAEELTEQQIKYAASDVLYLHKVRDGLIARLEREGRTNLAKNCFEFLPTRAELDLSGWAETDIFSHS
ncbi:MAG: ribonuclease D [Alphaproteobacteria bacterium]|nr:ribonuclease D [Alphaproteobacteria bacterium]